VSCPLLPVWMKYARLPSHQGITGINRPPHIAVSGTATQTYVA
jgi:hypothetical protein